MADVLDPARIMAAGFALGGLICMMVAPAPSWESAGVGLSCLLVFCGLWLVPLARPPKRRRPPIRYEVVERPSVPDQPRIVRELLPSHLPEYPAVRARLQTWRSRRLPAPKSSPPAIPAQSE